MHFNREKQEAHFQKNSKEWCVVKADELSGKDDCYYAFAIIKQGVLELCQ